MKKLLSIIFCLLSFSSLTNASTKIEEVFSDIDKNYIYYNELQVLYDKGMFTPDENGEFNPKKLLRRDEFVGILEEITCTECISPNVDEDLLQRYSVVESFFDVKKDNKYYYCIGDAEDKGFVRGYDVGTKCEDGTSKEALAPFCPNNTIVLEEALAVVLRASGILTNAQAEEIRRDILAGKITENLASDVSPKNGDGSVYSFYPDFWKGLSYELVEMDKNGNEKVYNLVKKSSDDKLKPKQPITKEDFLYMAYVALKANACIKNKETRPLINNGEKNVSIEANPRVGYAPLIVDFKSIVSPTNNGDKYSWDFGDGNSGIGKNTTHTYKEPGTYIVILTITDENGLKNEASVEILVKDPNNNGDQDNDGIRDLEDACPTIPGPKENKGCPDTSNGDQDNDGIIDSEDACPTIPGTKENKGCPDSDNDGIIDLEDACPTIPGTKENKGCPDSDNDGTIDLEDACPTIPGKVENKGCPIFDQTCKSDTDCKDGYYCNSGICSPKQIVVNCEYSGGDLIIGNVVCNSCPCSCNIDFNSNIRKCDIVFPAITSPDRSTIYGKGTYFEVK